MPRRYQLVNDRAIRLLAALTLPRHVLRRYIRLADEFVHVPGGSNRNNYANVELVVKVARRCEADAVWPVRACARGWTAFGFERIWRRC